MRHGDEEFRQAFVAYTILVFVAGALLGFVIGSWTP